MQQHDDIQRHVDLTMVSLDGMSKAETRPFFYTGLMARMESWCKLLPAGSVLTPHPGEMAALTGLDAEQVQADRNGIAAKYAKEWNCVLVLKGAFTVVAAPSGEVTVIPVATPALAKAGTGDVLA